MQYSLLKLMHFGRKLTRDELLVAKRFVGDLVVEDWIEGNVEKRPLKQAKLMSTKGVSSFRVDVLPPLFDPILLTIKDNKIKLIGWEINVVSGESMHHAQMWLLKPVEAFGPG